MSDENGTGIVTRRLRIHGRVQGVSYRACAQEEATRLGLRGWVRNRSDGSVEALVIGAETEVDTFIGWARRGPPKAAVTRVEIATVDDDPRTGFELRPTV
jgi:acylphosphatase